MDARARRLAILAGQAEALALSGNAYSVVKQQSSASPWRRGAYAPNSEAEESPD
jgi:hypothetical protein